jgi:phenylacetate-CoA ligase
MKLLCCLPRFKKAFAEMSNLESREGWSRCEIEAFQLNRLNDLWKSAISHVPYYRNLSKDQRIPSQFDSIEEFSTAVPVLSKPVVFSHREEFLSRQHKPGSWHLTGGSTGMPMRIFWAGEAYRKMLCIQYRFHSMWGIDIFDRKAFLWGHSSTFSPGIMGVLERKSMQVGDRLRNRLRLSAYRIGPTDLREHLKRLSAFKPVSIYGYSTALYLLAREAEETGFQCDSIKLVILTGEPALPFMVEKIENVFGVPAVVEYGSVECGLTAHEWPDRTLRVREDKVFVETQPREDSRYDILVTILGNPAFPLIRYALGDITDAPLKSETTGFSILTSICGRINDLVVSRSGRFVHSLGIKHVLEPHPGVRRFRAHQEIGGRLNVLLEQDDPLRMPDIKKIEVQLKDLLEGYAVSVAIVDEMPCTPAGKHRWIVSELAEQIYNSHPSTTREKSQEKAPGKGNTRAK